MKERITITIDKELIGQVDGRVDGEHVKSRSHAIEMMLRNELRGKVPPRAVILAAGKDAEMRPLTEKMPKAMLEVQGRPLIDHNLELLKRFNVAEVTIVIGWKGAAIKKHVGDGSDYGLQVSYFEEAEPLGTAGPLYAMRDALAHDAFIVLNADELKDINLEKMYRSHLNNEGWGTIALTTVDETSRYGAVMLEGERITRFTEKPQPGTETTKLINAGLYIFEPNVLTLIPQGYALLANDVLPKLARNGHLYGYPFAGQWLCPERPEELPLVTQEWKGWRA